jgi:hypothetical protein
MGFLRGSGQPDGEPKRDEPPEARDDEHGAGPEQADSLAPIEAGGIPLAAERGLQALGTGGSLFTSGPSVKELSLLGAVGPRPLAQVMGGSVVRVGRALLPPVPPYRRWRSSGSYYSWLDPNDLAAAQRSLGPDNWRLHEAGHDTAGLVTATSVVLASASRGTRRRRSRALQRTRSSRSRARLSISRAEVVRRRLRSQAQGYHADGTVGVERSHTVIETSWRPPDRCRRARRPVGTAERSGYDPESLEGIP